MAGMSVVTAVGMPKKEKREITAEETALLLLLSLCNEVYSNINTFCPKTNELADLFKSLNEKGYLDSKKLTDKGRAKVAVILTKLSEHNRHRGLAKNDSYPWHNNNKDWLTMG